MLRRRGPRASLAERPWCHLPRLLCCGCFLVLLQLLRAQLRAPRLAVAPDAREVAAGGVCVAWRATQCGSQYSFRLPLEDLPCSATIHPSAKRISGYCECADQRLHKAEVALLCGKGLGAEWTRARMKPFTCLDACEDKWRRHGPSQREDPLVGCELLPAEASLPGGRDWHSVAPPPLADAQKSAVRELWQALDDALVNADGLSVVLPPGARGFGGGPDVDFVAAGMRMSAAEVTRARAQWRAFAAALPAYPTPAFAGRGIVIVGGGLQYLPPAWVAVHALRRTGCTLPIEMWFQTTEMPDSGLAAALLRLGVAVRSADAVAGGEGGGAGGGGFALKVLAVLFSRFEEVLYLDSDNVALFDPTSVFAWPPYRAAGLLLWPDFWAASVAPDAFAIAPEARARLVSNASSGSVESGQLLLHKRLAWRTLLLTWFLNAQAPLYYRLLCSYMGTGDKETWAFAAALAGGAPPARAPHPAGSAGVRGTRHPAQLLSNTMVQHRPVDGAPLFAHCNLFKWTLDVPTQLSLYRRRWEVVTPPGWSASSLSHGGPAPAILPAPAQLQDAERAAWQALRALRCAPWFGAYLQRRRVRHGEVHPDAFDSSKPPLYRGMLLSEHAGGFYLKQWAWEWSWWRGPVWHRVAS